MRLILSILSLTTEAIWPITCLVCGRASARSRLCHRCLAGLSPRTPRHRCLRCYEPLDDNSVSESCLLCTELDGPIRYHRPLWEYNQQSSRIIHTMKYRPCPRIAACLGTILAENLNQLFELPSTTELLQPNHHRALPQWDLVIPIPAAPKNLRQRGFNQSERIARALVRALKGQNTHTPAIASNILARDPQSTPQTQFSPLDRMRPTRIRLKLTGEIPQNARVLLVDDVVTTGTTSICAARLLASQGATSIDLLSVARVPQWSSYRRGVEKQSQSPYPLPMPGRYGGRLKHETPSL